MSGSDSEDIMMTPPELKGPAQAVIKHLLLLPEKSRKKYNRTYEDFMDWKSEKNLPSISENVLLSYFSEKAQKYKPSTLWSLYSMLNSTLMTINNINIMEYKNLSTFIKRNSEGFRSKKSKVLTPKDVHSFLQKAPDDKYLLMKVILILGVNGACHSQELIDITTNDIEVYEKILIVKIQNTKTNIHRSFVISDLFYDIVKKYMILRPNDMKTNRFLLQYRDKKCVKQVVGKNKVCTVPKEIALYLNLPNPEDYTGRCFRRTSANILVDTGDNLTIIKHNTCRKSPTVPESYIDNSVENKELTHNQIKTERTESITLHHDSSPQPSVPGSYIENSVENKEVTHNQIKTEITESITLHYDSSRQPSVPESFIENSVENKELTFNQIKTEITESITLHYDSSRQPSVPESFIENSVENKELTFNQMKTEITESITLHHDSCPQPSTIAESVTPRKPVVPLGPQTSPSAVPLISSVSSLSQANINIPGNNITLSFSNCKNVNISFN